MTVNQDSENSEVLTIKSNIYPRISRKKQVLTTFFDLTKAFNNDLPNQLSPLIHRAFHADDLAIWTRAEYTTTAAIRLQEATNAVSNWAKNWGVEINGNNSLLTLHQA